MRSGDTLPVQNLGSSATSVAIYSTLPSGQEQPKPRTLKVGSGQTRTQPGSRLTGRSTPVYVQLFPLPGTPIVGSVRVDGSNGDLPAIVPANHVRSGRGDELFLPASQGPVDRRSCSIQNTASTPTRVEVRVITPGGAVVQSQQIQIPAFGSTDMFPQSFADGFSGSARVSSDGGQKLTAVCVETRIGARRVGAAAAELTNAIPAAFATAAKKAIAFGAVSSATSLVSVGVLNAGDTKVRTKVVVRDGTGKRRFARTLQIPARGTGFLEYSKWARGTDLYAEVSVRGKGEVVSYLLRTDKASGDVTYYPGVPLR